MRIKIHHETIYRYAESASYSIQALHLRPLDSLTQKILNWHVTVPSYASLRESLDVYGNVLQMLYVERLHNQIAIQVTGEVETVEMGGAVSGVVERFQPGFFLRTTDLTKPAEAIRDLAAKALAYREEAGIMRATRLMILVREALTYQIDETYVAAPAAECLARGSGGSQDFAHVFIAAARAMSMPARYVSGYCWTGDEATDETSHAWAEVYIPDAGWVGFDAANGMSPNDAYIRVASGLDYLEAAPVKGLRRGGGEETLEVHLKMSQSQQ